MEVFQGGHYFRWPGKGHPIYVFDRDKRHRDTIASPVRFVQLDDVHDAIDRWCESKPRANLTDLNR